MSEIVLAANAPSLSDLVVVRSGAESKLTQTNANRNSSFVFRSSGLLNTNRKCSLSRSFVPHAATRSLTEPKLITRNFSPDARKDF